MSGNAFALLSPPIHPERLEPTTIADAVGNTPLLWIGRPLAEPGRGFWAKLEGHNPGGIKDRAALHMVACARARGDLMPGAPIIESTSGTMGLGLALAGVVYGHPVILVSDSGMELSLRRLLHAYGARVDLVPRTDSTGGWQQARLDRVAALRSAHPDAWWPDQYRNPDNPVGIAAALGIVAGNTGIGALMANGSLWPWLTLLAIGVCATVAVHLLGNTGRLRAEQTAAPPVISKVRV